MAPQRITDAVDVRRFVDPETVARGARYAASGAVIKVEWRSEEQQLFGEVRGTASSPYTAWVRLTRDADGRLKNFQGFCTCPVRTDCKHSVALLLAAGNHAGPLVAATAPQSATGPWERQLQGIFRPVAVEAPSRLGLQLDLIDVTTRSPRTGWASDGRLALRPVTRNHKGAWVRTGVSWRTVTYDGYGAVGQKGEHFQLLSEIGALGQHSSAYHYSGNAPIFLDRIPSPRVWHLLAEAVRLGMPIVQAGDRGPVTLIDQAADLAIDVVRDSGLLLQPRLTIGDRSPELDSVILLGDPPHGFAWLSSDDPAEEWLPGEIRLGRLEHAGDQVVAGLVERRRLRVPASDEAIFFERYYPALRRAVPLVTSDDSVELPEPSPPRMHVTVVPSRSVNRIEVRFEWIYSVGSVERREPMRRDPLIADDRDGAAEARIESAVAAVAGQSLTWGGHIIDEAALHDGDALRFVVEALPALRAVDGVTVEIVGELPDYRRASSAPVISIQSAEVSDRNDWYDLAVVVAIDDREIPFAQVFAALATGQKILILDDGVYFDLDRPEFESLAALIAESAAMHDATSGDLRVGRSDLDAWAELEALGIVSGQAAEWQRAVCALGDFDVMVAPELPAGVKATLRPYQSAGFAWLSFLQEHSLGGILADEMGLGKTLQAIAMIARDRELLDSDGSAAVERAPFLVVAPTSVVYNWHAECEKFAPDLVVRTVTETGRRRGTTIAEVADGADVVVTSYALMRLEEAELATLHWAGLILDEAQFVKNHKSRTYQSARMIPARFRLAVTGTPMENNLMELWSLLSITAPGLFPSPVRFERHYAKPIERGDLEMLTQLRRRIAPLMLRRTKEQVAEELPPKQEQVMELALNPKHQKFYDMHLHRERQKVLGLLKDFDQNRFEIFRSLTLLRQASLDASLIEPKRSDVSSTKLDALMELLTEIVREGHRVLIFSQFTRFLNLARERIDAAGIAHCYLDGQTRRRAEVIERFRGGEVPAFLISLKAGGFGLNLTEADYCILLDPWWNPAAEMQAIDRAHRIGQTRTVMVYRLVAKGTIEEKVMALKAKKAALFGSLMSAGDEIPAGALTASDIRGILS